LTREEKKKGREHEERIVKIMKSEEQKEEKS
jgi:hypothetical protein